MNERPTPETDAEHAQFAMGGFTLDFCRKLERERDRAREDATNYYAKIGELERERDEAREQLAAAKHFLEKYIAERDEAREKVERQKKEIVRLNGATNHAGGTPLKIALGERDKLNADLEEISNKLVVAMRERDEAREALQRIADCDFVITLPDRMDAVRKIANDALKN